MKDTVLLIDGDTVAFRAAAITEERKVKVIHQPSGKSKVFKTRTEFKEDLQKRKGNLDLLDNYSFEDFQIAEPKQNAFHIARSIVSKLFQSIEPDAMEIYIGGEDNFREKLPLPSKYKGSREDSIRPINLTEVKDYITRKFDAKSPVGIEADDAINIRAYEELAKGNDVIIASNDKDTLQSEGVKFFDYTKEKPEIILVPEIGEIHKHKTVCKGSGLKFFAYQLLCGDVVDNYKPTEICKARFGVTAAVKLLEPLKTKEEILDAVVQQYKKWYPDIVTYTTWDGYEITTNWQGILDIYFQAAYMKRSWDDPSDWKKFFKERGWNET